MGLFDHFPYTNFHELNLDWVLKVLKEIETTIDEFVSLNIIKYADPIQWDITRQYPKNTIVIDPLMGIAYISTDNVPEGVAISNTDYWSVVFDLGRFITLASQNFANSYEPVLTTTATIPTDEGHWVVWNGILYEALNDIHIGDAYVEGGNIKAKTVESFVADVITAIGNETTARINTDNALGIRIDDEIIDRGNADTVLANAINAVEGDLTQEITDRGNADTALANDIGTLANLNTTDKTSLVNAINEVELSVRERTEDIFNVKSLDLDWSQDISSDIEALLQIHKRLYFPAGDYYFSLVITVQNVEIFGDGFYGKTIFHPTTGACITLDARGGVNVGDFYLHDVSIIDSDRTKKGIETLGDYDTDPINNVVINDVFISNCSYGIHWKSRGIWCKFNHVWCFAGAIGMFVQPPNDCAFNHNSFKDCMFGNNEQYGVYMISSNAYRNNTIQFDHCNFQDNWNSNPNTADVSNGFIYCNAVSFVDCYFEGEYGVANLYVRNSDVTVRGGVSILPKGTFCTIIDASSFVYIMGLHGYGASAYKITDSGAYNNHCVVIGKDNTNYQMNSAYVIY